MPEEKIYTATDLSRYHAGEMSPQEMHALEKAALSDPFLADALEGYAHTVTPEADVDELKQRLAGKERKAKVFFLGSESRWLRIAAMLVVFAGAGYFFYRFNSTDKVKSEAVLEQPKPADNSVVAADTTTTTQYRDTGGLKQDITSRAADWKSPIKETGKTKEPLIKKNAIVLNDAQTFSATQPVTETKKVLKSLRDEEGKETVTTGNIATADSISFYSNKNTNSNDVGYVQTTTPAVTTTTASTGFAKKDVKLSNNMENNIALHKYENQKPTAMNRNNAALKENKALLKKAAESDQLTWQEHGKMEPIDSVVFTDYADKNIREVTDSANNAYSGKVVLSFTVNKKGRPENIKVEQPLCKPCDEQAVQLLKNGPNWIYVPGKRKQAAVEY